MAFAAGILALQLGAALPSSTEMTAVVGVSAAVGALAWAASLRRGLPGGAAMLLSGLALAFVAAAAGWSYAAWRAELRLADALPGEWEGRDVSVTGVVTSLPQDFERGLRFVFEVEESAAPLPRSISLAWYKGFRDDEWHSLPEIHAGERWRLTVRLKRPHGNVNPHGFDYEGWLLEQGLRATGYVRPADGNVRLDAFVPGVMNTVERLREGVRARFRRALPDGPYAGVLVALAVGDQRAIGPELWRVFARTGISHLVAISGLHVTMIAALFAGAVSWIWRRSPFLALRWPARQAGVVAGFGAAFFYCLLAGWGVPAQRTLYMLGCVALALVLRGHGLRRWLGVAAYQTPTAQLRADLRDGQPQVAGCIAPHIDFDGRLVVLDQRVQIPGRESGAPCPSPGGSGAPAPSGPRRARADS